MKEALKNLKNGQYAMVLYNEDYGTLEVLMMGTKEQEIALELYFNYSKLTDSEYLHRAMRDEDGNLWAMDISDGCGTQWARF